MVDRVIPVLLVPGGGYPSVLLQDEVSGRLEVAVEEEDTGGGRSTVVLTLVAAVERDPVSEDEDPGG